MSHRQPFLNIRTEGSLLPSDLLSRLMEGTNLSGLKPEDYNLGAGEKLNEAISRSWARLLSLWLGFRKAKAALSSSDLGTTLTRERWLLQLFQELGYGRLIGATPFEIDEKTYPISHVWQGQYYQVPIHLVSFRADLDKRSEQRIQGASKASPHGMVQEFLNRSVHDLWAFVSNGLKLLILRDNASLTRQAYVEFDLEGIFEGEAYADFRLLWMVCHQSRLEGTAKNRPESCWLEAWSKLAQTDGRRALDQLRVGVEKALESLGTGFISHKANQDLCQRLKVGELQKQDLYRQLLRLVYRLIFIFVAEDRDLLHIPGASDEARSRYDRFYSGQRLRRMAERTRGSRHSDLWVALRLVFTRLGDDRGCPELGLPALGGFLFGPEAMPDLESAELSNEHLLLAIRNLGLVKDRSGWRLVDYRNLGSEELGSVYESLLELNPTMELDAGIFSLGTVAGNQRKTSGSYYTPDSLVQCLLDSALDPVVEQAIQGKTAVEAEKAILALKVCDPAVGSGHFLVGAAHRLAKHLANVRAQAQGEGEPSPLYYQHALRDVIGRCLYGVDVNPMATELCRVSLWLEAIEPGKPLSFLDHHIQVGNSLLGATPALLAKGIPDEAFTPIEGDDKEICSRFKKLNKEEKKGFQRLFVATTEPWDRLGDLAASMVELDNAPDDSVEAVRNKERMYEAMVRSGDYRDGRFWADTWCAAFVWKKTREFSYPITEEVFRRVERNPHTCESWMRIEIMRLSQQYQFFHWHLAFPDVFHVPLVGQTAENEQSGWNGGFDVILGNPPWDQMQFRHQEFFANSAPDIAAASTEAVRNRLIRSLPDEAPGLFREFQLQVRKNEGDRLFALSSGRFPFGARGRVNTYLLFTELSSQLTRGTAGLIVPTGLATDESGRLLFGSLFSCGRIRRLWDFENHDGLFADVDKRSRFSLFTVGRPSNIAADFCFGLHQVEAATSWERHFRLTSADLRRLNPNTLTIPSFSGQRDAELVLAFHRRHSVLVLEEPKSNLSGSWQILTKPGLLNMATDSSLFRTSPGESSDYAVYEGKMFSFYDHRYADVVLSATALLRQGQTDELSADDHSNPCRTARPRYWVKRAEIDERIKGQWDRGWISGWKEITSPTNARTLTPCTLPLSGIGHKIPVFLPGPMVRHLTFALTANLSSFACDFICRNKLNGTSLTPFTFKQLPAIMPQQYSSGAPWATKLPLHAWLLPVS